jgi:hypothetical protein
MIHITKEGHALKTGFNLRRSPGGFVAYWAWYDFATYMATVYRFRFRWHIRPRILWSVNRWNVIDSYLQLQDLAMVNREWLEDTKASWSDKLRRDRQAVQFGPHGKPS